MSTTPRLPSAIPGQAADFSTVTAHAGDLMARFGALYAEIWQNGVVPPELKELTRLRNARVTDCGF
ncbi:MAG: hypothetical protein AAF512_00050 [Pseudomonadota bacterium]